MSKRGKLHRKIAALDKQDSASLESLQKQLNTLVDQEQYPQALRKLQQIQRAYPNAKIKPSEGEIYLLQGQYEWKQENYPQAERTFKKALDLGINGESHYWLAKVWLSQGRLEEAFELIQAAFEQKILPKDYAGCYLKLLFLKGDRTTLETCITNSKLSSQFYAPQLHWARGILALQDNQPQEAFAHFQKMGRNATPGDCTEAWVVYSQQELANWDITATMLGFDRQFRGLSSRKTPKHPALQRLRVRQVLETKGSLSETLDPEEIPVSDAENTIILEMLNQIDQGKYHDAALIFLALDRQVQSSPAFKTLYRPLMLLGGEQAWNDDYLKDTQDLWGALLKQSPFDPHLALKYQEVLDYTESYRERQQVLYQLIDWLKKEAAQHPEVWPQKRLDPILARLHCLLTDNFMEMKQYGKGKKTLEQAAALSPQLPDVIGRQGLLLCGQDQLEAGIPLLIQALEGGCTHGEVYTVLLESLKAQRELKKIKEMRQRFGKVFGDLQLEPEVDMPAWIKALSTQSYDLFEELAIEMVEEEDEPALKACEIFVSAAEDDPNRGERVTLNQAQAQEAWDQLLASLEPQEQIPVLQAIAICLQRFAKRKKGIAGVQNKYINALLSLGGEYPEAVPAHLVVRIVKESQSSRLESGVRSYLSSQPQPGHALAELQLQARWFSHETDVLRPLLDEALAREPQNPLLLLAKATTFPESSSAYKEFRDQGFELARRLQDAAALQAFRQEEVFVSGQMSEDLLPELFASVFGGGDMQDMLRRLIRRMVGEDAPPEMIEALLPQLEKMMTGGNFPGFDDDDNDGNPFGFDPFGFGPFGSDPPDRRSRGSSRKRKSR